MLQKFIFFVIIGVIIYAYFTEYVNILLFGLAEGLIVSTVGFFLLYVGYRIDAFFNAPFNENTFLYDILIGALVIGIPNIIGMWIAKARGKKVF